MKTMREVCELTGVTRRTMQEYARKDIGLILPKEKNESGYWMYEDDVVDKIWAIKMFAEVGYTRKQIKAIFESDSIDIDLELKKAVDLLNEKKKRIDGMINTLEISRIAFSMPQQSKDVLGNIDLTKAYTNKNAIDRMNESFNVASELSSDEANEGKNLVLLFFQMIVIGILKRDGADTSEIYKSVQDLLIMLFIINEEDFAESDLYEEKYYKELKEIALIVLENENL